MLARAPASRTELARRFELEADCVAGVWITTPASAWANSPAFRSGLLEVVKSIGDDGSLVRAGASTGPMPGVHGTSEQRARWFARAPRQRRLERLRHAQGHTALVPLHSFKSAA